MRWAVLTASTVVAAASLLAAPAVLRTDPAKNLARVQLIVVTTARTTDITMSGATLSSYTSTVLGGPGAGASQTGGTLRTSNGTPGEPAEVRFDIILADVVSGGTVTWNLATETPGDVSIEVFSANDPALPRRVDRFSATATTAQFTTPSSLLASSGSVSVSPVGPHLVLAELYPWYSLDTWRDPELADRPATPYSSDNQADVNRQASEAHSAGIDAFVVSWQGPSVEWNDHRMRMVLDATAHADMQAAVFIESYYVNATSDPSLPADPGMMTTWIEDAVDAYGTDPAYLRLDNRPVIFVYTASRLDEGQWRDVLANVRATGRDPIVIGDFFHSRLINAFDGEYQYINVSKSPADLLDMYRTETLRVRTFNLLTPGDRRRLWVASVCPGYDDRRISSRATHEFVDRANGSTYDTQWRTAVTTAADWVIITTWNEFFENTHIEPSATYGTAYLDATRKWVATFKGPAGGRRMK